MLFFSPKNPIFLAAYTQLKWCLFACVVAGVVGVVGAAFLISLHKVTLVRESNLWLLCWLPLGGWLMAYLTLKIGGRAAAGNRLLFDELQNPQRNLPLRMAPFIFCTTLFTHLLGGSAGREGTAIQIGASLADQLLRFRVWSAESRRLCLLIGISAGFGSVFGTPLAAAIFALEIRQRGRVDYDALLPCLIAAVAGDQVARYAGGHHMLLPTLDSTLLNPYFYIWAAVLGGVLGWVSRAFAQSLHAFTQLLQKHIPDAPSRACAGGMLLLALVYLGQGYAYIGLGTDGISAALSSPQFVGAWAVKWLFTLITLSVGFKGGEVTPLFFIGAMLGNALAQCCGLPPDWCAALGLVAIFAGATHTPIASVFLAIELFGVAIVPYAALACSTAYLCAGAVGIYRPKQ